MRCYAIFLAYIPQPKLIARSHPCGEHQPEVLMLVSISLGPTKDSSSVFTSGFGYSQNHCACLGTHRLEAVQLLQEAGAGGPERGKERLLAFIHPAACLFAGETAHVAAAAAVRRSNKKFLSLSLGAGPSFALPRPQSSFGADSCRTLCVLAAPERLTHYH